MSLSGHLLLLLLVLGSSSQLSHAQHDSDTPTSDEGQDTSSLSPPPSLADPSIDTNGVKDTGSLQQVAGIDKDNTDTSSNTQAPSQPETRGRRKRFSNFVRVGRGGNFVRIGKNQLKDVGVDELPFGNQDDYLGSFPTATKRQMHRFIRIGRGMVGSQPWAKPAYTDPLDSYAEALATYLDEEPAQNNYLQLGSSPYYRNEVAGSVRIRRSAQRDVAPLKNLVKAIRRASSFVRIGKRPSSFVRIGKSPSRLMRLDDQGSEVFEDDRQVTDPEDHAGYDLIQRDGPHGPQRFVRLEGPSSHSDDHQMAKRPSSFVRIGRAKGDDANFDMETSKRGSKFVRIGKSQLDDGEFSDGNLKRGSSFLRIGKSNYNDDLNDYNGDIKRASSFVRIGKSRVEGDTAYDGEGAKRASSFVRIGKSGFDNDNFDDSPEKRASSFVRIGRDNLKEGSKRGSSFVRIGKSSVPLSEKRAGNFLRIGRRSDRDDGDDFIPEMDAQKKGFVRIGKTKNSNAGSRREGQEESLEDGNLSEDEGPINLASRGSAFVRIGKIPSSAFVRIGKNTDVVLEQEPGRAFPYGKSSRGGQSSFVRIGR